MKRKGNLRILKIIESIEIGREVITLEENNMV